MNREICDVKHPMIKDADELWVFWVKDNKWRIVNRSEFPKPKGSVCQLCPNGSPRTSDSVISCVTKVETWSTFKSHLVTVERIFGELIAFPTDIAKHDLPPVENYVPKYRAYGQLGDYIENESFYIYDVKKDKFITVQRNVLSKLYTKSGLCAYCPCIRKIQSPSSILQHIQSIENKYYCFLVLDNEKQNDSRNRAKIMTFVNSVKENQQSTNHDDIKSPVQSLKDYHSKHLGDLDERSQSSEYLSLNDDMGDDFEMNNNETDENSMMILNQMERCFKRDCRRLEFYFNKLKGKVNRCSLDQMIINSQEQLNLIKHNENYDTDEKSLTFVKELSLQSSDLDYLIKKFEIPRSYQVKHIELNLNLKMKPRKLLQNQQLQQQEQSQNNSQHFNHTMMDDENSITRQSLGNDEIQYQITNHNESMKPVKIKEERIQDCDSDDEENLLSLSRLRSAY